MPPPRKPRTMVRVEEAGQIYKKQEQSLTYPRGAVTKAPDMSVDIAKRIHACWMRIRRYLRELYDHLKAAPSLETRMVKAEAIEALVYMDALGGPVARNTTPNSATYPTGSCVASSGYSADTRRTSDNLVQPCPLRERLYPR